MPGDEWRLIDETGADVPAGEPGELWVRGPYTISGYLAAPDGQRAAFAPGGWYRTGDIVRQHPSGNFVVEGRRKDFINTGGEKVSAEEVEELTETHPAVARPPPWPPPQPARREGLRLRDPAARRRAA